MINFLARRNTRPWQWVVQAVVVLLIIVATAVWVEGKSFGSVTHKAELKAGPCANVRPQSSQMACHFDHGDYGRSRNVNFAPALRTKIIAAYNAKYGKTKAMSGAAWYSQFEGDITCVPIAGWLVQCTQQPEVTKVDKIIVGCGAAAIVGSLKGGGWWGAGSGGGLCLWDLLIAHW